MNGRKNLVDKSGDESALFLEQLDKYGDELALFLEEVDGYEKSLFLMKTDTYKHETTQHHRIYY